MSIFLHSSLSIILKPSGINSGIYFNRTDKDKIIPAQWNNVISTKFSTNIGKDDVEVKTVEHILSALAGLHINNCEISIDNIEVPILDGSSKIFVEEIQKVGVLEQSNKQNILEILKPEEVQKLLSDGITVIYLKFNEFFFYQTKSLIEISLHHLAHLHQ